MRLYQHSWPGNVRELNNYVQRTFIMADEIVELDVAITPLRRRPTTGPSSRSVSGLRWKRWSAA